MSISNSAKALYSGLQSGSAFDTSVIGRSTDIMNSIANAVTRLNNAGVDSSYISRLTALTQKGGPFPALTEHLSTQFATLPRNLQIYSSHAALQQSLGNFTLDQAANGVSSFFGSIMGTADTHITSAGSTINSILTLAANNPVDMSALNSSIASLETIGTQTHSLIDSEVQSHVDALSNSVGISDTSDIQNMASDPITASVVGLVAAGPLTNTIAEQGAAYRTMWGLDTPVTDLSTPISSDPTLYS